MKLYRILTDLESHFGSFQAAERFCIANDVVVPRVPISHQSDEDAVTPRICVTPTLEGCVTGIGTIGIFRRCLGHNEDAKSYAVWGKEVYPIIIQDFEVSDVYYPKTEQVVDAKVSGEIWLLEPTVPVSTRLYWLGMHSVDIDIDDCDICTGIRLMPWPPAGYHHPWIDGQGHVMDCSDEESDPPSVLKGSVGVSKLCLE